MTEGDSVTLKTNVTEVQQVEDILWKFGAEKSLIARMKKQQQIFSTYDGTDGRFRDRLKLDSQTGFLTITNTTTEHAGLYKVDITGEKLSSQTFNVSVYGECGTFTFTFTFNHLADAFIQSDVQMKRTIEAIRPSREQQYTSALTSLS